MIARVRDALAGRTAVRIVRGDSPQMNNFHEQKEQIYDYQAEL